MPLSKVIGSTLADPDEISNLAKENDKGLMEFGEALNYALSTEGKINKVPDISLKLSSGTVSLSEFLANFTVDGQVPFQPVGIGKPATIMLRHVYTGRFGKKGMLLTSAIRDPFTTFNLATRAINLMPKRVSKKDHITGPKATENGTELVYYINALTAEALTITFDMAFDDFPDELIDQIGSAIQTAGGIPIFGPYSGILLGVGMAVKLVSKLANALVDARPEFSVTEKLEFQIPGSPIPVSGYKVLSTASLNTRDFSFDIKQGLIHKDTSKPYDGDEPYIVYMLDGTQKDSFKNFTPTAASAAMLSRFLSQKEGSQVAIETMTDAFKLFSDMRYRREADRLQKEIDKLPAGSEERIKLEGRRDAAIANILETLLKPSNE